MKSKNLMKEIETYLKSYKTIQRIERIQKNLRLPTKFESRKQRVDTLLELRDKGRKILEKIKKEKILSKNVINKIEKIIKKADHLKRENCLLQVSDVIDVLKSNELSIFKEKSRNNIYEVRKYFALHKNLYYDNGLCVAMAVTKPKIIQNYHSHSGMLECTMILSGTIYAKGKINNIIKMFKAKEGDIIVIDPYTIHTLLNKTNKIGLNATVKIPLGFSDRKNFDEIPKNAYGNIKILKPKTIKKKWGEIKFLKKTEKGYSHKIDFLTIKPSNSLTSLSSNDTYIYVIKGNIEIMCDGKEKNASKDNLVFIEKKIRHKIKNLSNKNAVNLYRVREL